MVSYFSRLIMLEITGIISRALIDCNLNNKYSFMAIN